MRFSSFVFAAAAAFALTAPALAQDTSDKTPDTKDEMVCKTLPPPTGSLIGGRHICKTQREWDAREKQSQDAIRRGQTFGGMKSTGPGGAGPR